MLKNKVKEYLRSLVDSNDPLVKYSYWCSEDKVTYRLCMLSDWVDIDKIFDELLEKESLVELHINYSSWTQAYWGEVNLECLLGLDLEDKCYIRTQYDTDYAELTLKELVRRVKDKDKVEIIYEPTTFEEEVIVEY